MPIVIAGSCPGESCTYGYAVLACEDIPLLATDSLGAEQTGRLAKGDSATLVTGNLHLIEPGIVLIKRDYAITDYTEMGEKIGPARDTLRFFAGDTLYVLEYLELGSWKWSYRGNAGAGDEFWTGPLQRSFDGDKGRPAVSISEPREDWWYKLKLDSNVEGWVRTPGGGWWKGKKKFVSEYWDWKC